MRTTVIGAKGFIGRHLVSSLELLGHELYTPEKNDNAIFDQPLGHVIYCAGVTSDFRSRPFDTIRAHVSLLADLLERAQFESFVYLSSTRVYANEPDTSIGSVSQTLHVNPHHAEDLFGISKLMGESLCLQTSRKNVRIARVSNVCGDDFESNNFIYSIIKDALSKGEIILRSSLDSAKDYISIHDVVQLLINISQRGESKIYNVASGFNITNGEWISEIVRATGCSIQVVPNAPTIKFPVLDVQQIKEEFHFNPRNCLEMTRELIECFLHKRSYRDKGTSNSTIHE
ncbi:NAD-dependent epimerase/dehydratase family protein [Paenibacillus sediminis]|uniref:Nucleoside-diphosphate-sugar epimerase n=1 Tax=Paenibacillus sediminis TaxID=664909 RepID=A0ABS4H299_9BACL|nr:NAD-dependent epimerase/dehydratase family protein [Paenibacillus sediminis]MBP1936646.1 nucleoside-diphosphate-sugar epimerase [Paenibacillus sediminis]